MIFVCAANKASMHLLIQVVFMLRHNVASVFYQTLIVVA